MSTPNLPAPFQHQPELRALMMLEDIPVGHMTFKVEGDAFHPHLRNGEFAVIDLHDRTPAHREIFLYGFVSDLRKPIYHLCMMRGRPSFFGQPEGASRDTFSPQPGPGLQPETCWWAHFGIPPSQPISFEEALRTGRITLAEGPFLTEGASKYLIGRVVGVFSPLKAGEE